METHELWEKFMAWENWILAARELRRGKSRSGAVARLDLNREEAMSDLRREILAGTYKPGPYRTFTLRDPKRRAIAAPAPRDRLVHHALVRAMSPIWERRFVHHSYACRPGRGIHRAARACRKYARRFPWYLKFDVSRFYPSVAHEVLAGPPFLRAPLRGRRARPSARTPGC